MIFKPRLRKVSFTGSVMSRRTDPITNRRCATVQLASCRVSCIVTAIVTARRTVRFPVLYSFCWLVGPCGLLCSLAPCRACKFLYAARRLSLEKRVSKSWSCHKSKKMILLLSPYVPRNPKDYSEKARKGHAKPDEAPDEDSHCVRVVSHFRCRGVLHICEFWYSGILICAIRMRMYGPYRY